MPDHFDGDALRIRTRENSRHCRLLQTRAAAAEWAFGSPRRRDRSGQALAAPELIAIDELTIAFQADAGRGSGAPAVIETQGRIPDVCDNRQREERMRSLGTLVTGNPAVQDGADQSAWM